MEIITLSNGVFDSNTYIVYDQNQCAVIDCGVKPETIFKAIRDKNLKVRYIILTHGHVDHVFHADSIKKATGAPLFLHEDEYELYSDSGKNGYDLFGFRDQCCLPDPDKLLKHGDRLPLGSGLLEIIHTPGHTPGSISILCGKILISGDTLFAGSVGRSDLYGGSSKKLVDSVKNRLFTLDGAITVYPGHGPSTTISFERENNPYVL
jgi:glyoxylase-like metal-dependent hydrolase (beta-lactamase superfamily II)